MAMSPKDCRCVVLFNMQASFIHDLQKEIQGTKECMSTAQVSDWRQSVLLLEGPSLSQFLPEVRNWVVFMERITQSAEILRTSGLNPHLWSLEIEVETVPHCKHIQSLDSLASCWMQLPSPKNKRLTSAKSHFGELLTYTSISSPAMCP